MVDELMGRLDGRWCEEKRFVIMLLGQQSALTMLKQAAPCQKGGGRGQSDRCVAV
jgi:hypothetical protein